MVAVLHHIGDEGEFTNTIDQILAYDGVLTFDGAYTSVWEHREVLAPRQPILFVQGDTIGQRGICDYVQINILADMGFVLGWHGWTHRRLPDLPDHVVIRELTNPEPEMYKLYAYPHGDWDDRTRDLVKQMGYLRGYSTTQGDDNPFSLRRDYL